MAKKFYVCAHCDEAFHFVLDNAAIDPDPFHYADGNAYNVICPHCGQCACYLCGKEYNEITKK